MVGLKLIHVYKRGPIFIGCQLFVPNLKMINFLSLLCAYFRGHHATNPKVCNISKYAVYAWPVVEKTNYILRLPCECYMNPFFQNQREVHHETQLCWFQLLFHNFTIGLTFDSISYGTMHLVKPLLKVIYFSLISSSNHCHIGNVTPCSLQSASWTQGVTSAVP